jgi:hypothetical protein
MIQLNSTKKVLDYFNIHNDFIFNHNKNSDLIGNWYINIFRIDRKPIFILVNENTLLSFLIYKNIRKNKIESLFDEFKNTIEIYLKHEKFNDDTITSIMNQCEVVQLTRTHDRSILGTINDLVYIYKVWIFDEGGLNSCDFLNLFTRINRIPQRNLKWLFSIEQTKIVLKN